MASMGTYWNKATEFMGDSVLPGLSHDIKGNKATTKEMLTPMASMLGGGAAAGLAAGVATDSSTVQSMNVGYQAAGAAGAASLMLNKRTRGHLSAKLGKGKAAAVAGAGIGQLGGALLGGEDFLGQMGGFMVGTAGGAAMGYGASRFSKPLMKVASTFSRK